MLVSYRQVLKFLTVVSNTVPDSIECDGCFELIAEFADAELRGDELSQSMQLVKNHLSQCPCCAYEYATLLEGISRDESIDSSSQIE